MNSILLVFLGAGLGGVARLGANVVGSRWPGGGFPFATLGVNVVGSLVMGVLSGWLASRVGEAWTHQARLFLLTGVLGGFTTFSAFSLEAVALWERGEPIQAAVYVGSSVILSIAALAAGLWIARTLS
jgi:CrcB protein